MDANKPKTLAQALADEMAYAMDDIRHKLIEQPAFGQEITGDAVQLDVQNMRQDRNPSADTQSREVSATPEEPYMSVDIPHVQQPQGMDID